MTKPIRPTALIARIKRFFAKQETGCENNDVLSGGGLVVDGASHNVTVDGEAVALSPKEFEMLVLYYCDVIMNETEKMDKLIKDLLDLAQIESGMFAVKMQLFDVVTLVEDALLKFKPLFEQKGILVKFSSPEALSVNADPSRAEQIMSNFLSNAIDHLDERNEIEVSIAEEESRARVSVFNTGKHIPEEITDKIWGSFYKADESRAREYGGTGLGLSIVRAIQDGHGGGYGVENKKNGVEFWITLNYA